MADHEGMPTLTFNEQMVSILEARALELAGVRETGADGDRVVLQDIKKELEYYRRQVAIEQGTRPRMTQIQMGGV